MFGFNGKLKDNEIAGAGNHNTALFWEYDTRLGRRWNTDPVVDPSVSAYNVYKGNPIMFADPLGNTIKTKKEGSDVIQEGLTATIGKDNPDNPVGYDPEKGQMTFNKNYDRSKFKKEQIGLLNRYEQVITSEVDEVNFTVVDQDEKLPGVTIGGKSQSLHDQNASGITLGGYLQQGDKKVGSQWYVFVARNSIKTENFSPGNPRIVERRMEPWYKGLVTIHEIAGHAFLKIFRPQLSSSDHRNGVREFEDRIRKIYTNPDTGTPVKGYSNEDQ